jgi:carboxypeptidase Taq
LWENLVGRSRPFWEYFYPALQRQFPGQLDEVTLDRFYRGINKVQPTLIRVESDEATYNLHIMLRVEMEIGLLDGTIRVADLPDLWRMRMREYLGVAPETDAAGVLQDIHWSIGAFGYFATYTLGNVVSAQWWATYLRDHPDRDDQIRRGEFESLLAWLRTNIHQHGRKYKAQELVERVTGSRIDPQPYLEYLERKYRPIYGIDRATS